MVFKVRSVEGKDIVTVSGALTIQEVQQAKLDFQNILFKSNERIIDLSNVDICDTAGVQFLLSLIQESKLNGVAQELFTIPECVRNCAENLGVSLT